MRNIVLICSAIVLVQALLPRDGYSTEVKKVAGEVTLSDALRLALLHNPSLSPFSYEVRVRDAERQQSGAWLNPSLAIDLENAFGSDIFSGTQAAEATLAISQTFELGGKRSARRDGAAAEHSMATLNYQLARMETYAGAADAFVALLAAQEQLVIAEAMLANAGDTRRAVAERVRVGAELQFEAHRAEVVEETSRIDVVLARRQLEATREALAAWWGEVAPSGFSAAGDFSATSMTLPPLDTLLTRVNRHPEVTRWQVMEEQRRALARLERSQRVPDVSLQAGVRRHNAFDETAFVFGVVVPLPVFNRYSAGIQAATVSAQGAVAGAHDRRVHLTSELITAYNNAETADSEIESLHVKAIPTAELAATNAGEAYRAGRVQLTEVLATQRTLYELRARHVRALQRYYAAVIGLVRATGTTTMSLEVQ